MLKWLRNIIFRTGDYTIILYHAIIFRPEKFSVYWKETMRQIAQMGVGSLPIIAVVGTFVGAVNAIQFAYQMHNMVFMPMWWIGSGERKSIILELAPTITALLLAGRVGSNLASELGTMRSTEQIDAYELMGVNTPAYLIGPKILAGVVVTPMLSVIAALLGIIGGWAAGLMDKFYTTAEYFRGVTDGFKSHDMVVMMTKSILFGFVVSSVPAYMGYTAQGGSIQLARNATNAVVFSSIFIIIIDFLVAFVLL